MARLAVKLQLVMSACPWSCRKTAPPWVALLWWTWHFVSVAYTQGNKSQHACNTQCYLVPMICAVLAWARLNRQAQQHPYSCCSLMQAKAAGHTGCCSTTSMLPCPRQTIHNKHVTLSETNNLHINVRKLQRRLTLLSSITATAAPPTAWLRSKTQLVTRACSNCVSMHDTSAGGKHYTSMHQS
jgi:hypothetical protein